MKRIFLTLVLSIVGSILLGGAINHAGAQLGGGTGTINQLDQWVSTTTPTSAITQRSIGKAIKITGLSSGACLTLDSNFLLATTTCGSGGSQTPWTSNINGAGFNLTNVGSITGTTLSATSTTSTSTFAGPILQTGSVSSTYLTKIVPSTTFGTVSAADGEGTLSIDNTLNTLGMGIYAYTEQAGTPSNPLAIFRQTGSTNNQGLLWLLGPSTNSTQGGAYGLKVQDGDPDIEFVESDQTTPAGKYEFEVQNDLWRVNGRNTADNSFDVIFTLSRKDKGGTDSGGKLCLRCGPSDLNAGLLTIVGTSTPGAPYFNVASVAASTTGAGNIFTITAGGKVGIASTTPTEELSVNGDVMATGLATFYQGLTTPGATISTTALGIIGTSYGIDATGAITGLNLTVDGIISADGGSVASNGSGVFSVQDLTVNGQINSVGGSGPSIHSGGISMNGTILNAGGGINLNGSTLDLGGGTLNDSNDGTVDVTGTLSVSSGANFAGGLTIIDSSGNLTAASLIKDGGTSAQFLKADGSVDSSTYLTTASGASTYVPYTGATTNVALATRDLTFTTGKLGVGSTTPIASLSVKGTAGVTPLIVASSTNTQLLTVLQNGNVGIGNSDPQSKLHVTGTETGANWSGRIVAGGPSNAFLMGQYNDQAWLGAHNAALNAWADFYINPQTGTTVKTYIGNNSTVPILTVDNSTGEVGINTTGSPAATLEVGGTNTGIQTTNADSGQGIGANGIRIITSTAGKGAGFQFGNATTGSTNVWQLFAKGNTLDAGFGRANVQDNFLLGGTSGAPKTYFPGPNSGATMPAGNFTAMFDAGSNAAYVPVISRGNASQTANLFEAQTSGGTALTVIDASGKLGVGSSTPFATLGVKGSAGTNPFIVASSTNAQLFTVAQNGDATATGVLTAGSITTSGTLASGAQTVTGNISFAPASGGAGQNRTINFGANYGNSALTLYDGGAGARWGWGLNAGEMQFFQQTGVGNHFSWNKGGDLQAVGTNELMRLDGATGNLGIGTTSPISTLSIKGIAGTNLFTVASSTNAQLFTILQNGNIGIGSSTPSSTLAVNGTVTITATTTLNGPTNLYQRWVKPTIYVQPTAAATPGAAGRAYCQAFELLSKKRAVGITFGVGSASSGNIRAAIFNSATDQVNAGQDTMQGASLLVESADTAMLSANNNQLVNLATTTLAAGQYYSCLMFDNTTANIYIRYANTSTNPNGAGQFFDQAYGAYPSTAPTMTNNNNNHPGMMVKVID
jgi:hypothetical protein